MGKKQSESKPSWAYNWSFVKSISWNKFPTLQLYLDNEDHVLIMKRSDNSIVKVGYLHLTMSRFGGTSLIKFYDDICDLKKEVWSDFDVAIIMNIDFGQISPYDLDKLPKELDCYKFWEGKIYKQSWDQIMEISKLNHSHLIKLNDPNYKLIVSEIKPRVANDEETIMRSLRDGDADGFGF